MGRPKKTTEEVSVKSVSQVDTTTDTLDSIKQEFMKQLAEMQSQLSALKNENEALKNKNITLSSSDEEINGDTEIIVISQTVGKLVLTTNKGGSGTVYRFEKFGDIQEIPFSDLKDIVRNRPYFAQEGAYYIANEQAINKLRLNKFYEKIVDNDIFANLFEQPSYVIVEIYKNAPKLQKEQIVSMIEERLSNNQDVDGNVLVKIGKLCGKDFLSETEDDN